MTQQEYRVVWQREGQSEKRRALYQTLAGAQACVRRQETARDEMTWLNDEYDDARPKPLIYGPVIYVREVGTWLEPLQEGTIR